MSILVQHQSTGEYLLMCKGADSTMMDLCSMTPTERKASDKSLLDLACLGLRTLCISQKKLTPKDAQMWLEKYKLAATALQNRAEQMAQVTQPINTPVQDPLHTLLIPYSLNPPYSLRSSPTSTSSLVATSTCSLVATSTCSLVATSTCSLDVAYLFLSWPPLIVTSSCHGLPSLSPLLVVASPHCHLLLSWPPLIVTSSCRGHGIIGIVVVIVIVIIGGECDRGGHGAAGHHGHRGPTAGRSPRGREQTTTR